MKNNGFTLIELMVIIVMIGILAAIAVPKIFGMKAKHLYCEGIINQTTCIEQFNRLAEENTSFVSDVINNNIKYRSNLMPQSTGSNIQQTSQQSGYKELSPNVVLFYATNNEILANDIQSYKGNSNKTIKNMIPSVDGKTGPIIEFSGW